jgi:hypothetical protein
LFCLFFFLSSLLASLHNVFYSSFLFLPFSFLLFFFLFNFVPMFVETSLFESFLCLLQLHFRFTFAFSPTLFLCLCFALFHVVFYVLHYCIFALASLMHLFQLHFDIIPPTSFLRLLLHHHHVQVPFRPNLVSLILRLVLSITFVLCNSKSFKFIFDSIK